MADPTINPYAPMVVDDRDSPARTNSAPIPVLSSPRVLAMTGLGVVTSGAVFGALLMLVPFLSVALTGGGMGESTSVLLLAPFAALFGAMIAGLIAIPVIAVTWVLATRVFGLAGDGWTPKSTRRFASACGFLSGFSSLTLLSGLDPYGAVFSLVPGVFGWLITRTFVNLVMIRRINASAPKEFGHLVESGNGNVT